MIVGIDIDDTLTETTKYLNDIAKNSTKYNYVLDYHDLKPDDFNDFINKYTIDAHYNCEIKNDAVETINWLRDNGCKVIVITARGSVHYFSKNFSKEIESNTFKYFEKHNIEVDKIIFKQMSKVSACLKEHVDVFIDDKEFILDEIAKQGIKTIKMKSKEEKSKHRVVNSWSEIKDILSGVLENG